MQRPDVTSVNRAAVLRAVGFGVAVALGAVAIWLIVTSSTQKRLELGVLAGLWGLLIGAFSMFGTRRHAEPAPAAPTVGTQLELRSWATDVESAGDVAARRAEEERLQEFLRREIREAVNREVGSLRAEITALRTELLEKVGGQLRLEHIETTRLIGSDLEALQDEIRALKAAARDPRTTSAVRQGRLDGRVVEREIVERAVMDGPGETARTEATRTEATRSTTWRPGTPARPAAVERPAGNRPAEVVEQPPAAGPAARSTFAGPAEMTGPINPAALRSPGGSGSATGAAGGGPTQSEAGKAGSGQAGPGQAVPAQAVPAQAVRPAPGAHGVPGAPGQAAQPAAQGSDGTEQGSAGVERRPQTEQPPPAADATPPEPPAERTPSLDLFPDLPRLTPFVDDDTPPAAPSGEPRTGSTPPSYVRPPAPPDTPPRYEGRRRRPGEEQAAEDGGSSAPGDSVGRRRRDDSDQDNLLAKLLERERERHRSAGSAADPRR